LNLLANKVLKCVMNTGYEVLVKLLIVPDNVNVKVKVRDQTLLL
jgi:hypothetical protein